MVPGYGMPLPLEVKVDGLQFEYQLTEEDVRKVFSRYGGVWNVSVNEDGTSAVVRFDDYVHAFAALGDLNNKQLAGMQGAYLRVRMMEELAQTNPWAQFSPSFAPQMPASPVP